MVTQELGVGEATILCGPPGEAWVLDPSQGTAVYNCVRPEILCAVAAAAAGVARPGRGLCRGDGPSAIVAGDCHRGTTAGSNLFCTSIRLQERIGSIFCSYVLLGFVLFWISELSYC